MALSSGTQLGPYTITAPLGAGGMGEVYKATDTRLDRTVAIKVLPEHVAAGADLKQRFEREAKILAALSHPHICPIHDVGSQNGINFLVMEYLEGETLEQRLKKGALPLDQALQMAVQIADALAAAHRAGIIHRDLKPGNIMLTKSGAKLLDFGLAKTGAPAVAGSLSMLPTTPPGQTQQGTILGTLHYMAPEQVEGNEADVRSDIFALGAIVYEMATGKKAFDGKSTASVLAAILEREPPVMSAVQPLVPSALDRVVKKCLAKEPERRWQSVSDLADELRWTAEAKFPDASASTLTATRSGVARRRWLAVTFGALLTGGAIAGLAVWNLRPVPAVPVSRMVIALPPGDQLAGLGRTPVALSVDGGRVAYVASRGGTQQIYLRALDSVDSKPLSGTEGATDPFFSPDGQWLGFFADGKLKKVSLSGGTPIVLSDAASPRGASWGDRGTIVFNPIGTGPLMELPDTGGSQRPLTRLERGDTAHRWPQLLPGGSALLFAGGSTTSPRIGIYSFETGQQRNLIPGATYPRYLVSGHLVYVQGTSLMAVPFDARRLELTGAAVPVVENIRRSASVGSAHFSISATGSLLFVSGGAQANQRKLMWVSRQGAEQTLGAPSRAYELPSPRFSRDGGQLALSTDGQIWVYSLSRQTFTRFTFEGESNVYPLWTPDGRRIAFSGTTLTSLFWQLADGSGGLERLTTSDNPQYPISFSPDGQLLAFIEVDPSTSYDLWVLNVADRKAQPFLRTPFIESVPQFSPDGRWMAYVSNESGAYEVYVQPYPGPGGKWLISTGGGTEPAWNPNGRELFYRSADKMMTVDVATQPTFSAGKPKVLFDKHYLWTSGTIPMYDVSSDGQRFLMVEDTEGATPVTQINVVLNWTEELKRLVPPK